MSSISAKTGVNGVPASLPLPGPIPHQRLVPTETGDTEMLLRLPELCAGYLAPGSLGILKEQSLREALFTFLSF